MACPWSAEEAGPARASASRGDELAITPRCQCRRGDSSWEWTCGARTSPSPLQHRLFDRPGPRGPGRSRLDVAKLATVALLRFLLPEALRPILSLAVEWRWNIGCLGCIHLTMRLSTCGQTDDAERQSRKQESLHDIPPSPRLAATLQAWLPAADACDGRRGALLRRTNLGNTT